MELPWLPLLPQEATTHKGGNLPRRQHEVARRHRTTVYDLFRAPINLSIYLSNNNIRSMYTNSYDLSCFLWINWIELNPHTDGLGVAGAGVIDYPMHIQPDMPLSWCMCTNAAAVGGIASIVLPFLVNKALRASFTCLHIVVRSYMGTTKCSNVGKISSVLKNLVYHWALLNVELISPNTFQASNAVLCPLPPQQDVWSYPVSQNPGYTGLVHFQSYTSTQ